MSDQELRLAGGIVVVYRFEAEDSATSGRCTFEVLRKVKVRAPGAGGPGAPARLSSWLREGRQLLTWGTIPHLRKKRARAAVERFARARIGALSGWAWDKAR